MKTKKIVYTRFFKKIKILHHCWLWQGAKTNKGYGKFQLWGKLRLAHRASYLMFTGDIPKNMTIDHMCLHKNCVNPQHLRLLTLKENILCGNGVTAKNARKTHCRHGHLLASNNLYKTKIGRKCRECSKRYAREYYWHKNPHCRKRFQEV